MKRALKICLGAGSVSGMTERASALRADCALKGYFRRSLNVAATEKMEER